MASEEGHNPPTLDINNNYPATITCIMPQIACSAANRMSAASR